MEIKEGPILTEFLQSNLFSGLGKWQTLVYQGAVNSKLLKFAIMNDETEKMVYVASVIASAEKMMWQSFQDLLDHSIKLAAAGLQGIYGLDAVGVNIHEGIRNFNPQDYSKLIINHGRTLQFGQQKLIRYGQIFGLLHKRAPADWGKIDIATHVEIINPEKTKLSGLLKKMTNAGAGEDGALYVIQDLSKSRIWDLEKENLDEKSMEQLIYT